MKFNKGEFTLVPSKTARRGLKPALQVVYMWLADHANDNMECYPSRNVLAEECGVSVDTLDDTIKKLIDLELIEKEDRYHNSTQISNLYTINIVEVAANSGGGAVKTTLGGGKNQTQNSTQLTQPITLSNDNVELVKKPRGNPDSIEIVESFMSITGLRLSDMTKQRQYASRLLKREGKETVLGAIQVVAAIMDDKYAPRISDLAKLYYKWSDLQLYARKKAKPAGRVEQVDLNQL